MEVGWTFPQTMPLQIVVHESCPKPGIGRGRRLREPDIHNFHQFSITLEWLCSRVLLNSKASANLTRTISFCHFNAHIVIKIFTSMNVLFLEFSWKLKSWKIWKNFNVISMQWSVIKMFTIFNISSNDFFHVFTSRKAPWLYGGPRPS